MKDGLVLNIQRMSTEDGPGIRTTVFLKGCTLSCSWCHNPESISFSKEHEWFDNKCMRCKTCVSVCENHGISFVEEKLKIDESLCRKCFKCTKACPTNALEVKGINWTVDELYKELMKDSAYFENGGGITLSGGEVLAQADFAYELLSRLHSSNIHTAIDTCGHVKFDNIEKVFDVTSLFLYDLKLLDEKEHQHYTGADNKLILSNFIKLAQKIRSTNKAKLWVRTPLIPNATDTKENIKNIAEFIANNAADVIDRWELLAFNNLCSAKYQRLNKEWEYENVAKPSLNHIKKINDILASYDSLAGKVFITGTESNI